jgi:hypothetical protein
VTYAGVRADVAPVSVALMFHNPWVAGALAADQCQELVKTLMATGDRNAAFAHQGTMIRPVMPGMRHGRVCEGTPRASAGPRARPPDRDMAPRRGSRRLRSARRRAGSSEARLPG